MAISGQKATINNTVPSIKSSDLKLFAVACRRGYDYNDLMALGHGET